MSVATRTRSPGSLAEQLRDVVETWSRSQHDVVVLAARFADSPEWVLAGSPTAAHWLASAADVEVCTAREWIRIGRRLDELPVIAGAFDRGDVSYSKVRTLTRVATAGTEAELVTMALDVSAGELGRVVAAWLGRHLEPGELVAHQHRQRSVRWRHEPDGMVTFTLRLPPALAGMLIAILTTLVMTCRRPATQRGYDASAGARPTVAQQQADAFEQLLTGGAGTVDTEVVLHVRGDGCALDDGTPIPDSEVARPVPTSFVRALIHDAERPAHQRLGPSTPPQLPPEAGGEGTRPGLRRLRPHRAARVRPRPRLRRIRAHRRRRTRDPLCALPPPTPRRMTRTGGRIARPAMATANPAPAQGGVIRPHRGIHGRADLVPAIHDWDGHVGSVEVIRTR